MSHRKLATLRIISALDPISGADVIEVATVDSWRVIVQKGKYKVGSLVVYFEIDSWIPEKLAPFLTKKVAKEFNGVPGNRLKTIKMKGQISQGLILDPADITKIVPEFNTLEVDVTEILGIQKWEEPHTFGFFRQKGTFPLFVPKTDQERIQNLTNKFDDLKTCRWEVTEKYDGSSMTVYVYGDKSGVCSRNVDIMLETELIQTDLPIEKTSDDLQHLHKDSPEFKTALKIQQSVFWSVALREKLLDKIKESGLNIALQGELVGFSIGPNIYKLKNQDFYLYDIYDINRHCYFDPVSRQEFAKKYNIKHVPVLINDFEITESIDDLLLFAEGSSILNSKTEREGLVFKNMIQERLPVADVKTCTLRSFKAVSNKYLIENH